jgi:cobalt-zinc-cadmium efflux system membrane fusion protein
MTPERISADEIDVTPVGEGSLARKLIVPGTVVPNADRIARVPVKVVGTVAQLRKRLGDLVTEGEVVALIDSREVADARSEYLTALVNFDLQKTMFERAQQLWNQKISAEQQYLQARATFAQAQLRFDLARQKLSALDLDASELADAAKKDAVSPGALNLRQYQIRSPVSGRVVERRVDQGMAVGQEGNPSDLYTVADLSSVWVELAVPAPDLDAIKQGRRVVISSGNNGNKEEGRIMFVSPLLNQETRSARVIAEIDNKSLIWRPGLFVTAEILIGEERVDLRIPRVALQTINGKKVAFVRTPEGFQKRDLKIGIVDEEFVEVTNGLVPHERIAISNTFLIKAELGKAEAGHDE